MSDFRFRAEDLKDDEILPLYVETSRDKHIVEQLMGPTPVILEGSRGTGKSFLLRVARCKQLQNLVSTKVLPVYVSFAKSSLIHTSDENQFTHWMLARLCSCVIRELHRRGFLIHQVAGIHAIAGGKSSPTAPQTKIEEIVNAYENSYKNPGTSVDPSGIPSVEEFRDAVEDLCLSLGIARISVFFDEAAHIFRPAQQRSFFTLFRDLRSPYVCCNAAVYPGVTSFGPTFEKSHDATHIEIARGIQEPEYRDGMREIVVKQADSRLEATIEQNRENFFALAYAVSGNPRLLLKTISRVPSLRKNEVNALLKEFYRTEIWSEHSGLADRYAGHTILVDWGREFIEKAVIPETRKKNDQREVDGRNETTCYFWLHRDAPEVVKEALRLLSYTGIVRQLDSGVVATRSEIGTRYAVKLGVLAAQETDPISALTKFGRTLSVKRFTEFGANHSAYSSVTTNIKEYIEPDMSSILSRQLGRPIDVLELSLFQLESLKKLGLDTIGKALNADEDTFREADYIGPKRARRMMNAIVASVLEFLSG